MSASIRLSSPGDRDAILEFIARCGFNPRDAVTWDGLNMQAMTAWQGGRLIGAIPYEPRQLQITANRSVQTIHETVVAIDPGHRGGGLGSEMQSAVFAQRPFGAELVSVFREDPVSGAYRWYLKNGFLPVVNVQSWFCNQPIKTGAPGRLWKASDSAAPFPVRPPTPGRLGRELKPWLMVHPYRNRYSFWIIEKMAGPVALLGVGTMHSDTERVDVLDWIAPDLNAAAKLLQTIGDLAAAKGWQPIRVPLAAGDPLTDVVRALGYESRWSFDLLIRSLSSGIDPGQIDFAAWRYAGIDYI